MRHQRATQTRTAEADQQKGASTSTKPPVPTRAPVHPMLHLQQTIGNRAVQRLLQAKLKIGQPGDRYEQEADRVAEQVMRMPEEDGSLTSASPRSAYDLNRIPLHNNARSKIQPKLKVNAPGNMVEEDAQGVHETAQRGLSGSAGPLPYLGTIQQSFGRHDVMGVKAHVGGPAREANEQMGASAYATGKSVAFKQTPDLHTAAHEAAHIVHQRAGAQLKGGLGRVGDQYEQHADAVADAVVQGRSAESLLDRYARPHSSSSGQVQFCPCRTFRYSTSAAGRTTLPSNSLGPPRLMANQGECDDCDHELEFPENKSILKWTGTPGSEACYLRYEGHLGRRNITAEQDRLQGRPLRRTGILIGNRGWWDLGSDPSRAQSAFRLE